ncbi:MAG: hypothetical protein EA341_13695 [Mongoliibacter sp.]|jgi:hypothetical protein|uniref:DUF5908 family protein n=1 Tax=Mongoliibacter sp. TaxID=2022438 RepID=UPI0012F2948B|nr:DUF5908 family protein [Mongoliibacter sp.]TVP46484.1 MAG: hypothetical protein EA341_13695 [Mongoliibacter sp.]
MTLIIKQLVIRGEVIEDNANYSKEEHPNQEAIIQLIEDTKRKIENEYHEKMLELIEKSSTR